MGKDQVGSVIPVRTAAEHAEATARLRTLMESPESDANAAEIQAQASLIEAYERTHFPIEAPTP